jgi:phosphatidylglycerophosphate synthase
MTGIGYVILFLAHADTPDAPLVWIMTIGPLALPLGLIIYRLIRGRPQGPRSATLLVLMTLCAAARVHFGPEVTSQAIIFAILALTVVSGFSYLVDAWSALKGKPGSYKEVMRFVLDGVLVPVAFVQVLGFHTATFTSIAAILIITLELMVGGLGNLLASQKKTPRFRWMAAKSIAQVALASAALAAIAIEDSSNTHAEEILIALALAVTVTYTALSYWRHRRAYLSVI